MNTYSAQLDEISSRIGTAAEHAGQAVTAGPHDGDQSGHPDGAATPAGDSWPGAAPPAYWFLPAPRRPVITPSAGLVREEPGIGTGPGGTAPQPGPAGSAPHPATYPYPAPEFRQAPEPRPAGGPAPHPSVWERSYYLWRETGLDWAREAAAGEQRRRGQAGAEPRRTGLIVGRRAMALGVPVLVLALVAATAVALLTGHGPGAGEPAATRTQQAATFPVYPGQQQRGVFAAVNRIVLTGTTAVATAQRTAGGVTTQQFLVSRDGGATWHFAPVPAGQATGHVAPLLAGSGNGWVAIGPEAIWTSRDGLSWRLAAAHGISTVPGDTVHVVTATASGFLAGGLDNAGHAVVWTSPDGMTWQRTVPAIGAATITYATAYGSRILIAGIASGGTSAAWLSTDDGATWTAAGIPDSHGGTGAIAGVASGADGLLAVRAGAAGDAITYLSHDGISWHYAGTLGASSGLRPRVVKGNGYGFVVAGRDSAGRLVAYRGAASPSGQVTWRPMADLGHAAAEAVVGAAVAPRDTVIAIGATAATPFGQRPVLTVAAPARITVLPVPEMPALAVAMTAAANGTQVAVGSADGYPAIWSRRAATDPWRLVTVPAQFSGTGLGGLTSVAHGPAGWLAVGRYAGHPLLLTSRDGVTWRAAGGTAALAAAFQAAAAGQHGSVRRDRHRGISPT